MSTKDFIDLIKDNKLYDALQLAKTNLSEQYANLDDYNFETIGCFEVCNEKKDSKCEMEDEEETDETEEDENKEDDEKDSKDESCKK